MYRLLIILLCITTTFSACNSDETTVVFVGDLLLDRGVRTRIEHLGMDNLFHSSIDSVFTESDIVVANLECPATSINAPINKKFIFRAEPDWLASLKDHGITHLNMANNHSMDQGRDGLVDTKNNIKQAGLIPLGYGKDIKKACEPTLITNKPRNIYVLSSLQVPSENWVFLEDKPCVCEDSFDEISNKILRLKNKEPKAIVIVQLHWGAEHTKVPLISQKQQAYMLIDAGADVIIGHHSHTIQTIEMYKEKPIYYSIGNFIFDQNKPINSKGLLVQLKVREQDIFVSDIEFDIKNCSPKF
ncbi:CapA family protein [Aquimarina litoralis]|uniref:CapA family protein n=1 Tax=Aquimarina litoralis TaxID=584605 RepID=UPI001C55B7C6|nr:CapA family protein [Aquimarina litoralis]